MAIISQKADAINEVVAALYERAELPDISIARRWP